jgi:murein DD-endopeptidase MepM/ murein hydrolase activator NlpD
VRHYLLLLIGGLFFLAGCGGEAVVSEPEPTSLPALFVATPTVTAVPQPQLAMPAIVTASPAPTVAVAATYPPAAAAAVPPTSEPEAEPTPAATFTPPAPGQPSPHEHFWLGRPVPQGGVVWTDKVYPYGSTRGGTLRTHHGVEFYVPGNTPIYASAPGTVMVAGDDSSNIYGPHPNFYGSLIVIRHDFQHNGKAVFTLYAHLSQLLISEGQRVNVGEQIAWSGATGVADGPHLHFEVRVGENSYNHTRNPLLWLYPFTGRGVVAGRVTWPDGSPVYEAPLTLRRLDAASAYAATTSYADDLVNGDDHWQENFALDDVVAGYYELTLNVGSHTYRERFWVYANQTSFVEFRLDP